MKATKKSTAHNTTHGKRCNWSLLVIVQIWKHFTLVFRQRTGPITVSELLWTIGRGNSFVHVILFFRT